MKVNNNISALQAFTSLTRTNANVTKSMRKLSSGIRINSVADDAAGMSISNKLKMQVSGLSMAARNTLDGISLIQVGEGALQEVHNMLHRIRELSIQSANGTNESSDRLKLDDEVQYLLQEITDTSTKTEFNNMKILSGDAARLGKIPLDDRTFVNINFISDSVFPGKLQYNVSSLGMPAPAKGSSTGFEPVEDLVGKSISINGESLTITAGDTPKTIATKLQEIANANNLSIKILNDATWENYESGGATAMLYSKKAGIDTTFEIKGDDELLSAFGFDAEIYSGTDAVISSVKHQEETLLWEADGNRVSFKGSNSKEIVLDFPMGGPTSTGAFYTLDVNKTELSDGGTSGASIFGADKVIDILDYGMIKLQIGTRKSMELDMQIPNLSAEALGISLLHIKSSLGANQALSTVDKATAKITEIRSKLGAYQNRLQHTETNLKATEENTSIALSRIYDADVAWEMTMLSKDNVLVQAGMSILSQANQRPQQILQLLK